MFLDKQSNNLPYALKDNITLSYSKWKGKRILFNMKFKNFYQIEKY